MIQLIDNPLSQQKIGDIVYIVPSDKIDEMVLMAYGAATNDFMTAL